MSPVPYWHVDAFSDRPFAGNQAAVMLLDAWLPDDALVAIAEENKFAETAFITRDQSAEADWELRWCTPTYETALCGHATLASGHVALSHLAKGSGKDSVTFRTRQSGVLEVRRSQAGYELALPALFTKAAPYPEAEKLLGARPIETFRNPSRYNIFLFEDEAQIRSLDPNLRALGALGNDQFICTAPGQGTDIVSRVFVPGGGVDEDSVTGSAHAALAPYWAAKLDRSIITAHQASRRGGDLTLRLEGDRVWLGGPCVTVVEGSFFL